MENAAPPSCLAGFASPPRLWLCRAQAEAGGSAQPRVLFRAINFTASLEPFQSKVLCDMITQGELSCICLMKQIPCLMILRGIKCS